MIARATFKLRYGTNTVNKSNIILSAFYTTQPDRIQLESSLTYCKNLVKTQDYDNYLCSHFYPRPLQAVQHTLRAFNLEIASVREAVSDPLIGKMRMQFWKDIIEGLFQGKSYSQPVAIALQHAITQCTLSPLWFKRIITERETNLMDSQFTTLDQMEKYGENTASSLLYLQLESLSIHDVHADHAASHIGKAASIVTLLRSLPFHASNRRLVIPTEIMAKHGVVAENIFRTGPTPTLADAVFEVSSKANDHILMAQSLRSSTPKEAMPVLLAAIPIETYLKRLEAAEFNVFEPKLQVREWRMPLLLWRGFRNWKF